MMKTLYWVDREWYDNQSNRVVGDMGFTFCDASDTLTDDMESLVKSIKEYANEQITDAKEEYGIDYLADNADFPIYTILKADFDLEDEDDYPCMQDRDDETLEALFSCAYCTSKRAKEIIKKGCELNCDYFAGDFYKA